MEYILKNGKIVNIRKPDEKDAEEIVSIISAADTETLFLARNPGEFRTSVEKEKAIIQGVLQSTDSMWFVAEYEGKVVGQCSIGLVKRYQRYRHRAEVAFILLEQYCNIGIGGKMMEECLKWCHENYITQVELDVVSSNEKAIKMYKNFGFKITGTLPKALRYPDGNYANEYKMIKFL